MNWEMLSSQIKIYALDVGQSFPYSTSTRQLLLVHAAGGTITILCLLVSHFSQNRCKLYIVQRQFEGVTSNYKHEIAGLKRITIEYLWYVQYF